MSDLNYNISFFFQKSCYGLIGKNYSQEIEEKKVTL